MFFGLKLSSDGTYPDPPKSNIFGWRLCPKEQRWTKIAFSYDK